MTYEVPNQDKTLGMQRRSLPQIDVKALLKDPDFLVTNRDMQTKDLIPTQKHFNDEKVNGMISDHNDGKMAGKKFDGVIISKDGYIIDGHHRALAAHNTTGEVGCLQIDDNVEEALDKLDGKDYVVKKKLMESKKMKSFKEFMAEAIAGKDSRQTEINFEPTIADTLTQGTDASINPDRAMSEPGKKPDGGKWLDSKDSPHYKHRDANELGVKSPTEVDQALRTDSRSVEVMGRGHEIEHGQLVGARLNLNVLKNTKVPVLTLHKATNKEGYKVGKGFYKGTPLQYHHVVTLKNAHFNVDQTGREQIATGQQTKFPMASVDGEFQKVAAHSFDGVEARFNPMQHHLFVDPDGRAIRSAEEVTLHGHRAYLRGKIEYHNAKTAPKRKGDHPSLAQIMEGRKEIEIVSTGPGMWDAKAGKKTVGRLHASDNDGKFMVNNVGVSATHRRLGIATKLYSHAEQETGKKLVPSNSVSDDAFKFWSKYRPEAVADDVRHHPYLVGQMHTTASGKTGKITSVNARSVTVTHDDGTTSNHPRKEIEHLITKQKIMESTDPTEYEIYFG